MLDRGEPIIQTHMLHGTAEEANRNRDNFQRVCEQICGADPDQTVKVTVEWSTANISNQK